ncbi:hypothetical protein GJW-30_1_03966 [Variibacter gotjawalensis]|uniref:DUF1772 domain-containing protein n=1 Tax=Variibacter gotjawalensis TaxID=1333996 RepID=A0A0S3PZP4_9BRAD|nr:anthrone oxygenase family protein [Variibacter gotjawalensis]NIK47247.1 putative membrane protein [Variibacter gotjawalensis]RZS49147.1 putative membrane protein [Variibacter gotjawalensis]BAT61409.1 hypothetical protein GJW-30_1_03966 [Variibacter gotjawalensis]
MTAVLTFTAALGCGLVAGIFFAFSNFVMAGLERIPPEQGIAAMQSINVTVLNPLFLGLFTGTAILSAVIALVMLINWQGTTSLMVLAAAALYVLGCFGVTMAFNVPLNNALMAVQSGAAATEFWAHYLDRWVMWNSVRTAASLAAAGLFTAVLMR